LTVNLRGRSLPIVLELQCTCGWLTRGDTKEALLEQVKPHVRDCPDMDETLEEGVLRALIAQRARPVEEATAGLSQPDQGVGILESQDSSSICSGLDDWSSAREDGSPEADRAAAAGRSG
jgi:hypothetical protein